jgi:hypothetical protein
MIVTQLGQRCCLNAIDAQQTPARLTTPVEVEVEFIAAICPGFAVKYSGKLFAAMYMPVVLATVALELSPVTK